MQFFTLPTPVANTRIHFLIHILTHIETHGKQGPVSNICELFSFSHFARCVRSKKRKLTASLCHLQHTPHPGTFTHTLTGIPNTLGHHFPRGKALNWLGTTWCVCLRIKEMLQNYVIKALVTKKGARPKGVSFKIWNNIYMPLILAFMVAEIATFIQTYLNWFAYWGWSRTYTLLRPNTSRTYSSLTFSNVRRAYKYVCYFSPSLFDINSEYSLQLGELIMCCRFRQVKYFTRFMFKVASCASCGTTAWNKLPVTWRTFVTHDACQRQPKPKGLDPDPQGRPSTGGNANGACHLWNLRSFGCQVRGRLNGATPF